MAKLISGIIVVSSTTKDIMVVSGSMEEIVVVNITETIVTSTSDAVRAVAIVC